MSGVDVLNSCTGAPVQRIDTCAFVSLRTATALGVLNLESNGHCYLAFSNERSKTTLVFGLGLVPGPDSLALAGLVFSLRRSQAAL